MPEGDTPPNWQDKTRAALHTYSEDLLRQVAAKLTRPRQRSTADEIRERVIEALDDPISIDRVLKSLHPSARRLLAIIAFSGTFEWSLQSLVDLLPVVGFTGGIGPIRELLDAGLVYPKLDSTVPLETFDSWIAKAATEPLSLYAVPLVTERCRQEPLDLDAPTGDKATRATPATSDGLEWPLRLFIVWQIVHGNPLRLTQAGSYFKRDLDRLRDNPLLGTQPAESPIPIADPAMLTVELARQVGLLHHERDELLATPLPDSWLQAGTPLSVLCPAICRINAWDPIAGLNTENGTFRKLATIGVALMATLATAPPFQWHDPDELASWLRERQPDFGREVNQLNEWCRAFLLGVMYSIGAVEAAKLQYGWRVRLTTQYRDRLQTGQANIKLANPTPTLLVQPNLEVVLFRQGLTPPLAAQLTRMADWKQLGLACTLSLNSESVYRGLESGLLLEEMIRILERHSTRPIPESVLETLRSWSSKRERVQVYSSAMLLEFRSAGELQQALKLGLIENALTDRIGMVSSEKQLDYSRFRLVGTRDYLAPEERCVDVAEDGLTLSVHDGKADLLLTAEVRRFADSIDPVADDRSTYRMSIESLQRARANGVELRWMDEWFFRRTSSGVPATAKLLFLGEADGKTQLTAITILRLPSEEMADGIENWPAAKPFLTERLGATTFAVQESKLSELKALLASAGIVLESN